MFMAQHVAHPLGVGEAMGSILGLNCVMAKDAKIWTSVLNNIPRNSLFVFLHTKQTSLTWLGAEKVTFSPKRS